MIDLEGTAVREWLAQYLAGQINTRAMTRTQAVAHINASLERVSQVGTHSASEVDRIAAAMIAALPRDPA
jgi:hypothetical protein